MTLLRLFVPKDPATRPGNKPKTTLPPGAALMAAAALALGATTASAQPQPRPPATSALPAASAPASKLPVAGGPTWTELSPAQRDILMPLAGSWSALTPGHKRKWLEMTKSYPALSTEEQAKMQGRMKEWVALSPQQRAQARLNFAKTRELSQELTAEEKKAKWQAYQALTEEEKRKLAAKAPPKPAGATAAPKPVEAQKLATVPSRTERPKAKPAPTMADAQPSAQASPAAAVPAPDGAAATPARAP